MAHDRMAVLGALLAQGVVPVFHHADVETAAKIVTACVGGGAACVEYTNRGDFAAADFLALARRFAREAPALMLGVGSVTDAPTAALYIANGAKFVVSPSLDADTARLCNRRKIAYLPGCGSVTEIAVAEELGCEIVKVFPGGSVGGPEFVKAVLGPMPWTRIMPTGGVEPTEASLKAWFGAGAAAVGVGSGLISKALVEAGDYAGLQAKVAAALTLAAAVRKGKA
jgi:2-dehydro-3-deoxyphosphogluconate aldolase/(4S)-4-hydroxy-2-oxoglutarate aldolase